MKCDIANCDGEALFGVVDGHKLIFLKEVAGQVIDCDDPASFRKYCESHWTMFRAPKSKQMSAEELTILGPEAIPEVLGFIDCRTKQ